MNDPKADDENTTIQVKRRTAEALRELGSMGESYDDVICRLLQKKEGSDA
jgi:predicted CopG family antitoxin